MGYEDGGCRWGCQTGFFQHAFQALSPSLGLAGILPGNIAADIIRFLFNDCLLGLVLLQSLLVTVGALSQVSAVVAAVFIQGRGHLPDGFYHLVQEIAVVRHNHGGSIPIPQVTFQPFNGGEIKVVGWFIQQQHIVISKQQFCQEGTGELPTGKLVSGGGENHPF